MNFRLSRPAASLSPAAKHVFEKKLAMHATIGWKLLRDLLSTSLIPAEGKSERKQYQQVSNGQKIRKQSASVNHGIGNLKGSNQNQPI